jgi:hypothetical protein
MGGQGRVVACHDRQGRETRRVVAAAGQDHLRTLPGQGLQGLVAHLGHDVRAGADLLVGGVLQAIQGLDLPRAQTGHDHLGVDVGIGQAQAEAQVLLPGDLLDQGTAPLEVGARARAAGRADDHRDAPTHSVGQHRAQVGLDPHPVGEGLARAQVVGARIRRAGVHGDQVGTCLQTLQEGGLGEPVAQDRRRRQDLVLSCHIQSLSSPSRGPAGAAAPGSVPSRC